MSYFDKYIKYKNKYLALKKLNGGTRLQGEEKRREETKRLEDELFEHERKLSRHNRTIEEDLERLGELRISRVLLVKEVNEMEKVVDYNKHEKPDNIKRAVKNAKNTISIRQQAVDKYEKWLKEPMHTETEKISKKIFLKKLIDALVKLNATYDRLKFIYSLIM